METLVPGRIPRAGLLLLPLLLCFGPETAGTINPAALKNIVNRVTKYGVRGQYAFAICLKTIYCQNVTDLEQELPERELKKMQEAIEPEGGLYNPGQGNIVAARVNKLSNHSKEHAEWRLLKGRQNSPVSNLLAQSSRKKNCLIFFTLNSPCTEICLAENGPYNILQMVNDTFHLIDGNNKAFVFRHIYQDPVMPQKQLEAWHRLPNIPLYRCNRTQCSNCRGNNPKTNACLHGM